MHTISHFDLAVVEWRSTAVRSDAESDWRIELQAVAIPTTFSPSELPALHDGLLCCGKRRFALKNVCSPFFPDEPVCGWSAFQVLSQVPQFKGQPFLRNTLCGIKSLGDGTRSAMTKDQEWEAPPR